MLTVLLFCYSGYERMGEVSIRQRDIPEKKSEGRDILAESKHCRDNPRISVCPGYQHGSQLPGIQFPLSFTQIREHVHWYEWIGPQWIDRNVNVYFCVDSFFNVCSFMNLISELETCTPKTKIKQFILSKGVRYWHHSLLDVKARPDIESREICQLYLLNIKQEKKIRPAVLYNLIKFVHGLRYLTGLQTQQH